MVFQYKVTFPLTSNELIITNNYAAEPVKEKRQM